MNLNNRQINTIGLFDSGIGGLSVLQELQKVIPNCNYLYFADTKNIPYGTKSNKEILFYSEEILKFFMSKNVKNVVIACNTVSAIAYNLLQEKYKDEITLFPVLQYGLLGAKNSIASIDKIAVLATRATILSMQYENILKAINPKIEVLNIDGTGLVEIVEGNLYNTQTAHKLITNISETLKTHKVDNIIWGCTHYCYLKKYFDNYFKANYINPATFLAKEIKNRLGYINSSESSVEYYTSGNAIDFTQSAKQFIAIDTVQNASLQSVLR